MIMGVSLFVDRISGGIATLIYRDGEFTATLPLSALPKNAREGDWLSVSFEIDSGKKKQMKRDIDLLMDELER